MMKYLYNTIYQSLCRQCIVIPSVDDWQMVVIDEMTDNGTRYLVTIEELKECEDELNRNEYRK